MTQYVASISYGKDSLAMLEAIKQLGLPLDRIVTAEVFATDDISADLPPMMEFKIKADEIIKERYGIDVEHICAKIGGGYISLTKDNFINCLIKESTKGKYTDYPWNKEILTYEKVFYRVPKRRGNTKQICSRNNHRVSSQPVALVQQSTQNSTHTESWDFQWSKDNGATAISRKAVYGFPVSVGRGNWCTGLKTSVF